MPYPVTAVPGSTPRTFTSSVDRRQRLGVDIEVGGHLRHVVGLLQRLHESQEPFRIPRLDLDGVPGDACDLRALDLELLRRERVAHRVQLGRWGGDDVDVSVPGAVV